MHFTVPVSTLCKAMSQVANVCTSNAQNPDDLSQYILVNVHDNRVNFLGTDKNVQLSTSIAVLEGEDYDNEGEGQFLIAASKMNTFFKTLGADDNITFTVYDDSDELALRSSRAKYNLRVRHLTEDSAFPSFSLPADAAVQSFKIEERKLCAMLNRSMFCVSKEHHRAYLKGVRFEIKDDDLTVFALDGHRMAALVVKIAAPVSEEINFQLTLRGAKELEKLLDASSTDEIEVRVTEEFVCISKGDYTFTNRLLCCSYPNVRGVLPQQTYPNIPVNLADLKTYVKRISTFSNKRVNAIKLSFTRQNLEIRAENAESEGGEANLMIDFHEKESMTINLNAEFLLDFLNAMNCEQVIFGFSPPYNNTQLTPSNNDNNELGIVARYVVSHIQI